MSCTVEGTEVQAGGEHVQRNCGRRSQSVSKGPKQSRGQNTGLEGRVGGTGPDRSAGPDSM